MDESIVVVDEWTALEIELMMVEQPTITVIMVPASATSTTEETNKILVKLN
ncbi:hypothetical protein M3M38_04300 [Fructilactobacillus cliffordii]|uniref:hypothetical protein n=1 Tax=Fructilactobacillus cliffordii TaxID=2940299 RepID=UPI002092AFE8|nr:hypothetical protein [Fructilactobacillus cliffordii]USS85933.1 hypothetical protein M3M38_04300 [Fructilactobacillus cliffordii]